ncbi:MAG: hypothetical protein SFU98_11935 [Leptospiraceae bacterium]|nr:hypothetical protein [Leptospiraceae bacterium]
MFKKISIFAATLAAFSISLYAVAPDLYNLNVLIQENRAHFEFINVIVSNMIPPKGGEKDPKADPNAKPSEDDKLHDKKMDNSYYYEFLTANQKDLEGNIYYMKNDYSNAFVPLREAQGKLKEIFESALERHNEYTRVLTSYASTRIVRTDDYTAKWLLKKAFAEQKTAENYYTAGWNNAPYQFRNKISLYELGLHASRRARRFALLALIELKTPKDEKRIYKKQKLNEYRDPSYDGSVNDYEYIKKTLRNQIENKHLEQKISTSVTTERPETATSFTFVPNVSPPLDLMEALDDCYNIITYDRISVLEETNNFLKREGSKDNSTPPKKEEAKGGAAPTEKSAPAPAPTAAPVKK